MAVIFIYTGTTPTTTFTCGRDPAMGNFSTTRKWMSPSIRSGGGKLFVYGKNIVEDIVSMTWQNMNQTDLLNLLAFLTIIDGSANSFEFIDVKSVSSPVVFWGPDELRWTPVDVMGPDIEIELLIIGKWLTDALGNRITDALGNYIIIPNSI